MSWLDWSWVRDRFLDPGPDCRIQWDRSLRGHPRINLETLTFCVENHLYEEDGETKINWPAVQREYEDLLDSDAEQSSE